MRRVGVIVVAGLLLGACGSGHDPTTTSVGVDTTTSTTAPAVPLVEAVDQLGSALEEEIATPSEGRGFGWFDYSETLQEAYVAVVVQFGAEAVPLIEDRIGAADPVSHGWYVVALGYLGEPVDDELMALLSDPPSRPILVHAMELAGRRALEEAVPVLTGYLKDDYSFQDPHRPGRPPDYPVRDVAAAALRRMGYVVYSPPERPWDYEMFGR